MTDQTDDTTRATDDQPDRMLMLKPPRTEAEARVRLKAQRAFGAELRAAREANGRLAVAREEYDRLKREGDR